MKLTNKYVVITGGSIGIGRETAYAFADAGANVIITYFQDHDEAEMVCKKCRSLGAPETAMHYLNLMDNHSIKTCAAEIREKYGQIDVLINNAGVTVQKPFSEQTTEQIELQTRTNFEGLIKITSRLLPAVRDVIINIGSGAGMSAHPGLSVYSATKWAVRGFTKNLAEELDTIKTVTVNPGTTATRMTGYSGTSPATVASIIKQVVSGEIQTAAGDDVNVWERLETAS